MKCSCNQSNHHQSLFMVCILVLASSLSSAMTWYVDPVDGSDLYDGTSPFYIENTLIGPKQTIGDAAMMAGDYDILVLSDGVYSGQDNTDQMVFGDIDYKHLTVIRMSKADNCILNLSPNIISLHAPHIQGHPCTTFQGLTFTCDELIQDDSVFHISNGVVHFEDCVFTQLGLRNPNYPMINVDSSSVTFSNCQFTHNQASKIIGCGFEPAELICQDCTFEYNRPSPNLYPGDPFDIINISDFAYGLIENCSIRNHMISDTSFNGIALRYFAGADVKNCVIENNICYDDEGGCTGVYCDQSSANLIDTQIENLKTVSNYYPSSGVAIGASDPLSLIVQHCTLKNNAFGIYLNTFKFSLEPSYVLIMESEISGYYTEFSPEMGSIGINFGYNANKFDIEIHDCHIHTHDSGIYAMSQLYLQRLQIENCLINNNLVHGFDMLNQVVESPFTFKNCTIVQNGHLGLRTDNAVVSNCIIRDNGDNGIPSSPNITVDYCNVQGGWPEVGGDGNIDVDPLFADGGRYWPGHPDYLPGTDFHLKSTAGRYADGDPWGTWVQDDMDSPCIDAGDPDDPTANEPYGSGGRINMGTYGGTWEASRTDWCMGGIDHTGMIYGDINRDCTVDLADIAIIAENWLQTTKMTEPPIL